MPLNEPLIATIKGFLDPEEGRLLYRVAREASRRGPCLEIGGYCGKSTIYIAAGCKENGQILYSVDHHRGSEEQQPGEAYFDPDLYDEQNRCVDTFKEFRKTLARADIEETVVPVVCRSSLAAAGWTTPLSLVFIDGGHGFSDVFTDYTAWSGHIIPDGYLAIHDIFDDPAMGGQAPYRVYQLAVRSGLFERSRMTRSLGVLKRAVSFS
jgi:predicted O-methyltransferase YrrM